MKTEQSKQTLFHNVKWSDHIVTDLQKHILSAVPGATGFLLLKTFAHFITEKVFYVE